MGYSVGLGYGAPPQAQTVGNPRFESLIKSLLCLTAWRFGKEYGGHLPTLMIMHCLRNRHTAGWSPWLQIIENVPKFSATLEQPTGMPETWDRNFVKILSEVDSVMDSTSKDLVNKAKYFGDLNNVTNPWFLENIARNPEHTRVADMGTLVFWS